MDFDLVDIDVDEVVVFDFEIDSDNVFGELDEERLKGFMF